MLSRSATAFQSLVQQHRSSQGQAQTPARSIHPYLEAPDVLGLRKEDVHARARHEAGEHGGGDELHERPDAEQRHGQEQDLFVWVGI